MCGRYAAPPAVRPRWRGKIDLPSSLISIRGGLAGCQLLHERPRPTFDDRNPISLAELAISDNTARFNRGGAARSTRHARHWSSAVGHINPLVPATSLNSTWRSTNARACRGFYHYGRRTLLCRSARAHSQRC
jgi:hypothetical protein